MLKASDQAREEEIRRELGEHVKARRLALGYKLPSHVPVPFSDTMSNLEKGNWMPRLPVLLQLAQALKCTISDLTGEKDDRAKPEKVADRDWRAGYAACALDVMQVTRDLRDKHT